ncbi:MAG TPA: hypothetical protein VFL86_24675 [Burkholderiaceae bacterium]|nr:hypothetical protein [Burkholderiaceae bacterium]
MSWLGLSPGPVRKTGSQLRPTRRATSAMAKRLVCDHRGVTSTDCIYQPTLPSAARALRRASIAPTSISIRILQDR